VPQRHPGNLLHSSGLATNDARHDVTQGRVAMDAEPYDRAWRIEQRAEELFKRDYPSGSFARRLPHFRSSYPDPVGDHYQRLAAKELSNQ
jgi:hypothetical protein